MTPTEKRFWSKVDKSSTCWLWTGTTRRRGYGLFYVGKSGKHSSHRWLYELMNGPQRKGIEICHHCDNPGCVNPTHLFAGTKSQNMQDMVKKGRGKCQFKKIA